MKAVDSGTKRWMTWRKEAQAPAAAVASGGSEGAGLTVARGCGEAVGLAWGVAVASGGTVVGDPVLSLASPQAAVRASTRPTTNKRAGRQGQEGASFPRAGEMLSVTRHSLIRRRTPNDSA